MRARFVLRRISHRRWELDAQADGGDIRTVRAVAVVHVPLSPDPLLEVKGPLGFDAVEEVLRLTREAIVQASEVHIDLLKPEQWEAYRKGFEAARELAGRALARMLAAGAVGGEGPGQGLQPGHDVARAGVDAPVHRPAAGA